MKLSSNQKIVLLLFIVAIVSVVFMEYTREYVDNVVEENKTPLDHANEAYKSGLQAVNSFFKK